MTRDERQQLEVLRKAKVLVAQIARQLSFCRQTIYNELNRGAYIHTCDYWDEVRYSADKGQQIHDSNQSVKGRPLKIGNDRAYANFLEKKMLGIQKNGKADKRKHFSPAAALAAARSEGFQTSVCITTLYSYIKNGYFYALPPKTSGKKESGKNGDMGKYSASHTPHCPASPTGRNRSASGLSLDTGRWIWWWAAPGPRARCSLWPNAPPGKK